MSKVFLFADYSQAEARVVAAAGPIPPMRSWFESGEDIHLNVAKLIGKVVNENKIPMPHHLFEQPYQELHKDTPERQLGKSCVHGQNYDMQAPKFGTITGLPKKYAQVVMDIYHGIFPEIRNNYHAFIRHELRRDRTVTNPLGWKRTFYDIYSNELERAAYAWYPQSTIGLKTVRLVRLCCEIFQNEVQLWSPTNIRAMGLDIQLQVHDSVAAVLEDDATLIRDAVLTIKRLGEEPLLIRDEELIVPMDFKTGPNWGDLHDYKLVA